MCFQARLKVLSQVDRGLSHTGRFNYDGQSVELTRATGGDGKSTILKAKWAGKQFRVNVIPAIKSEDIKNSYVVNPLSRLLFVIP